MVVVKRYIHRVPGDKVSGFENFKEVLNHRMVQTVPLMGHALGKVSVVQRFLVFPHLVMPSLIRMEDGFLSERKVFESLVDQFIRRPEFECIGNDFTVKQIQYRRQVEFLPEKGELRHIGHPFLIWFLGREIPAQYIRRYVPAVGTVLLYPDLILDVSSSHQLQNGFRVEDDPSLFSIPFGSDDACSALWVRGILP